jgi:hypothetical protein
MKKHYLTLTMAVCTVAAVYAQDDMNFEPTGVGAGYTWNVFENDTNPSLEFVANPNTSVLNPSPTVAKYTTLITGKPWAGCETSHSNGMADFVLDSAHAIIRIMVYKSVISDVGIKLVTPTSAALPEIRIPNTLINQWEEITFDFTAQIGFFNEPFDQIVIFPDFSDNPRTYGTITYFDNISFGDSNAPTGPEPMQPAPDPTLPQAQVISLFSNVYTDVLVDTWQTPWSSATLQDIQIQGNDTKKYTSLNYVGAETVAAQVDAAAMTHFNMHVWSANFTQFRIKLVDFGANGTYDGVGMGDDKEHELTFDNPLQEEWITYHIPLTDFVNLTTRSNLAQYVFSTDNNATVFADNVYFSYESTAGINGFTSNEMELYPNPAHDAIILKSTQNSQLITISNLLGQQVLQITSEENTTVLDISSLQNGVYVISKVSDGKVAAQRFIKQ